MLTDFRDPSDSNLTRVRAIKSPNIEREYRKADFISLSLKDLLFGYRSSNFEYIDWPRPLE